jgi:hypothetical protein
MKNSSCKKALYSGKENKSTQGIAVGSKSFVEKMKEALGFRANSSESDKNSIFCIPSRWARGPYEQYCGLVVGRIGGYASVGLWHDAGTDL